MNKKIIISLAVIGVVAAIAVTGTVAFFSDTETSTGNTFTAGSIDLKIDNESYVTDENGDLVYSTETSWELSDLTNQVFFDFSDLKPGDMGEDTISIHVDNNDAWICMSAEITANDDMTCTEPELGDDPNCPDDGGELAGEIEFIFWADDGDNVLEDDEASEVFEGTIQEFYNTSPRIVADSNWNIFTGSPATPLTGGETYYIAKAWCFGNLSTRPLVQDDLNTNGPLTRSDLGIYCDGAEVNNAAQSDQVVGNISFTAVQARNNSDFSCNQ